MLVHTYECPYRNLIRKDNDAIDDFHMDIHSAICVAYHLDGGELYHILVYCKFATDLELRTDDLVHR